jgi:L-ascorbate metabolism protein UlaG (beta-lactamase superfamily)
VNSYLNRGIKLIALFLLFLGGNVLEVVAQPINKTQLLWYGHAAFKITTPSGKVLLLDPWITNPTNKNGKEDLAKLNRADLILISHGHFDHVGDATEIAKKTKARLVTTADLGQAITKYKGYPKDLATLDTQGNFGGKLTLLDGEVEIAFIPAIHSSTVAFGGAQENEGFQSAGNPGGFLIMVKNGPTFYHTGDTDLFADMALIPHFNKVNVMLACIGGHFTMGPERAAEAVNLVKPDTIIPMHFGTFPALDGTPRALEAALKRQGVKSQLKVMQVGETLSF